MGNRCKCVLILGCGRSGSSIFGELFEHLTDYQYFSEPHFEEVLSMDFRRPIAIKVPRVSKAFTPDPGLPIPMKKMLEILPDGSEFFWQLRHPLDSICSLKVGIAQNWGHHPKPPDWKRWLSEPLVKRCAHHWNYINSVGFDGVSDLVKISRFETMIRDPLAFALDIGKHIDLDIPKNLEQIKDWSRRVQDSNNRHFVEAKTSRPYSTRDHRVKVGRWKENMSWEELQMVRPIVEITANKFNYQLPEHL